MKRYAELNSENIVVNVIVATDAQIALLPGKFINSEVAITGSTYDEENDKFIAQKPYPSWTLNENFEWEAPSPRPAVGTPYMWDEESLSWVELEIIDIDL